MKLLLLTGLVCAAAGQSTSLTNNANERASQLAGNTDTYFAPADAPKCFVDGAGRTIVHYQTSQHPSFKCYHTDTNHCKCESVHPTHHKGLCKVFHASSGKAHVLGGNCGTSGMNMMSSCKQILVADPTAKSGMYTLKRASDGATFSAYCDMSYDGGGWTQCMRSAFRYEARHLFTKTYKQVFPTTSAGDGTSSNWYGSGRVHGNQAYPGRGQFATSSSVRHWTWSSTAQSGFGCYYGTVPSTVPGNMLGAGNPTPTINAAATSVLYRE